MRFFRRKTETRAAEAVTASNSDRILRGLLNSSAEMTAEKALNIPAVAGAVGFIASLTAMLPMKLYRESADHSRTEEIRDDPRLKLLNEDTGDLMNPFQMKRAVIRDYLLTGGGYIFVNRRRNEIRSLNYVSASAISVSCDFDPIFKDARMLINGGAYYPHEFIVMARNSTDGVTGKGVVEEHREILTGIYNMIVFEKKLLQNGGSRKGFLEAQRRLAEPEMRELREAWEKLYSNYGNGVMILNDGIKFVEASNTSVEMQLNESKQTDSRLIYSLFNLSEGVVSGTATDEQSSAAIKTALLPIVKELETAVNRACLLEEEKEQYYFVCDTSELLKGDILKRYQAYQIGLNANFLQPDEVRYKEDFAPLGLDFIKLGLNDVLYNPETKEIYTPNTNQTAEIGENFKKGVDISQEYGIIKSSPEERMNPNHDPKNGRFTSGSVSATGENYFNRGFSKHNLEKHWGGSSDHSAQYPNYTREQYAERALQLIQSKADGKNILGYKNALNEIVRYDVNTNDFVKGNPKIGIKTMFKPKNEQKYYESRKRMEGLEDET